jgi:micrococcal nuclease
MTSNPYIYKVTKIHKFVDGDTIQATIDLGFGVYIDERFRLNGINTAELHGPDSAQALKAQKWLENKLKRCLPTLWVQSEKRDSFRRWLGTFIYVSKKGEENINKTMVDSGLAVVYKRK